MNCCFGAIIRREFIIEKGLHQKFRFDTAPYFYINLYLLIETDSIIFDFCFVYQCLDSLVRQTINIVSIQRTHYFSFVESFSIRVLCIYFEYINAIVTLDRSTYLTNLCQRYFSIQIRFNSDTRNTTSTE